MKSIYKSIGELVERIDQRNTDGTVTNLIGVSIDKKFINSVANVIGTDLTKYKIIEITSIYTNPVSFHHGR